MRRLLFVIAVLAIGGLTGAFVSSPMMMGKGSGGGGGGGGGTTCDIGPTYMGSIPAPAMAAGFTHCAANYDFTNAAYTSLGTWLNCSGTYAPATPQWYYQNVTTVNCADWAMVADGSYPQVLKVTFTLADYNANRQLSYMQTTTGSNSATGTTFPNGQYIEMVNRVDAATVASPQMLANSGNPYGLFYDLFSIGMSPGNFSNGTAFGELDWLETYTPNGTTGSTYAEWNAGCTNPPRCFNAGSIHYASWTKSNYVTVGARFTQDTSGNIGDCNYFDSSIVSGSARTLVGCHAGTWVFGASDASISEKLALILYAAGGHYTNTQNNCTGSGGSCAPPVTQTDYYQRITVWTCALPTSNGCAGTVLTN